MEEENKWKKIIVASLLADKDFDIKEANNFEQIKSLFFDKETYTVILNLINKKDWDKIKNFNTERKEGLREYLDIFRFTDQNQMSYVVTIYDSDELWQDPQIIDIIPLA